MRWHDHLFVHWPIEATSLRDLVPRALSIDTFEGVAWVGITAFRLSKVGLRYLPDVPLAPSFLALAVRTCVTAEDKPGIWFFSIDVSNKIIGLLGKPVFGVPFFNARMALETGYGGTSFWSRRADRRAPAIEFDALYSPFGESFRAEGGSIEAFLTRRYCFYAEGADRALYRTEFHHKPWIFRAVDGTCLINDYLSYHKIEMPAALPLLHLSGTMDVVLYPPTKL
jgi:uncharacterized protein YqjF (DUF2071 family)